MMRFVLWLANADQFQLAQSTAWARQCLVNVAIIQLFQAFTVFALTAFAITQFFASGHAWWATCFAASLVAVVMGGVSRGLLRFACARPVLFVARRLLAVGVGAVYAAAVTLPVEMLIFTDAMEMRMSETTPALSSGESDRGAVITMQQGTPSLAVKREALRELRRDYGWVVPAVEATVFFLGFLIGILPYLFLGALFDTEYACALAANKAIKKERVRNLIHGGTNE